MTEEMVRLLLPNLQNRNSRFNFGDGSKKAAAREPKTRIFDIYDQFNKKLRSFRDEKRLSEFLNLNPNCHYQIRGKQKKVVQFNVIEIASGRLFPFARKFDASVFVYDENKRAGYEKYRRTQ